MTTSLPLLTDFSDRLSPMVVKELRQGLRTRTFGSTMLLLHAMLILITLNTGMAENAEETGWILEALATVVLCLVMPLRVSNALAEEVKQNTLDMLMLTRLSCSRIVFGKWASVALQSLLIALSLMPYVVARYVFGSMDLVLELGLLTFKWLLGTVVAAALVALSTIRQSWLRLIIILVPLIFGGFGLVGFLFASASGTFTLSLSSAGWVEWLAIVGGTLLVATWSIYACLSFAASRISPPSAPLAWQKRSVHLLALTATLGTALFTQETAWMALAYGIAGFMTLDAMTEHANQVPSAYLPFYRRGALGRAALLIFSPGWPSGFALSVVGSILLAATWQGLGEPETLPTHLLACCTFWMVPALIQVLPLRRAHDLLPVFLGTFCLLYLLVGTFSGLALTLFKSTSTHPWPLVFLPPSALIGLSNLSSGPDLDPFQRLAMLCGSVWPLLLVGLSLATWRRLRPVLAHAQRLAS